MPFYTKFLPTLFFICYQLFLAGSGPTCYNPDQTVPEKPYYVCNTTSGEHSACCGPGDPCSANGYCFGSFGFPYRGGSAVNSFSNLYLCPMNNGSHTTNWCCGPQEDGPESIEAGCCESLLFRPTFGDFANAEAVANTTDPETSTQAASSSYIATSPSSVASSTSPSLSEPAVTTTPTFTLPATPAELPSSPPQPSHKSVAVGVGVGVPVAVLVLFGLVLLFLRERRRRVHAQKLTDDAYTTAEERERASKAARQYELHAHALPQELEYVQQVAKEILSREVYEANAGS
ncbi:MAG: hypothetical protein Q9161_003290 [Pseudevernia consocians]